LPVRQAILGLVTGVIKWMIEYIKYLK
jgi:hypothetical protein